MKTRLLPILLCLGILLPGRAATSPDDASKFLKKAVDEVVAVAKHAPSSASLAASVRPVLQNSISFGTMTRRAVGPGWRQFTPDQQKEAVHLFTTLVIRTYANKLTPGEVPAITYKPESCPSPGRIEAPTTLVYQGSHYDVIYRQEEAEGWRITDVVIEGVSLVANYRTQFDARFKEGGANAVIASLNQSVNSNQ